MKKSLFCTIFVIFFVAAGAFLLSSKAITSHTHTYTSATCTSPATCIYCGATTGSPLGHSFYTYQGYQICSRCGYIK